MGCDGIWDCVDIQKFTNFVSKRLKEKIPISIILKESFSMLISKNQESLIYF